ncbi:RraA family protein [Rhizobium paknamense]|uniref:Putative 4-hydroxy-4-methyl-2-oxoglutarate aldolase n=1 Tax=Rhizobium paknamense TaxID=1206817 RepID=A0ABU0IJH5_9HYPH|nr:RraA family protein [Rhizobium paknamense]MDQ0458321.1 RraA family protein [Rhizobium paknamense]
MALITKNPNFRQAEATILEGFATAATAVISDNLQRLPGSLGLQPFHAKGGIMVGTALTVRTRPGDNLAIHEALEQVRPGDVIVVDGGGDLSRALIGEIMVNIAIWKKAAGLVIDGAIRDVDAIAGLGMPCFARGVTHKGPYKDGPGEINVPVCIGGMVIQPGDIVVGDQDGVVSFSQEIAVDLLKAVQAQEVREAAIIKSIHEGTYKGAYGKPATAAE